MVFCTYLCKYGINKLLSFFVKKFTFGLQFLFPVFYTSYNDVNLVTSSNLYLLMSMSIVVPIKSSFVIGSS